MRKQHRNKQSWFGRLTLNFVMSASVLVALSLGIAACARKDVSTLANHQPRLVLEEFLRADLLLMVFLKTVSAIYVANFGSISRANWMATGSFSMKNFYMMMVSVPAVHGQLTGLDQPAMAPQA